jgi:hypothetical protein
MVKIILTLASLFFVIWLASTHSLSVNGKSDKSKVNPIENVFKRIIRGHLWYTYENDTPSIRITPKNFHMLNEFFEKFVNFFLKYKKIKHL